MRDGAGTHAHTACISSVVEKNGTVLRNMTDKTQFTKWQNTCSDRPLSCNTLILNWIPISSIR